MDLLRIPVTNPGAIPNSGSIQFTAQIATVAKINFNRIVNDEEYNAYINACWYILNSGGSSKPSKPSKPSTPSSPSDCGCKKSKKSKKSKHRKHH